MSDVTCPPQIRKRFLVKGRRGYQIIRISFYLIILATFFPFTSVRAEENKGLHVSPTRIIDSANANGLKTINFTLVHKGDRATSYDIRFKSFELINNNFEIKFQDTLDPDVEKWILNKDSNILLEPDKPKEFELKLQIPSNASNQGYSFAIFFESQSLADDKHTVIRQSIGIPVILNIESAILGESSDAGLIVRKFETNKIQFLNNVNFDILIENAGKFFAVPIGSLEITKELGIGENTKSDFNDEKKVISANSSRSFTQVVNLSQYSIGKFKAKFYFVYGSTNRVEVAEYEFWVLPWWFIIIVILIVIFLVFKVILSSGKE